MKRVDHNGGSNGILIAPDLIAPDEAREPTNLSVDGRQNMEFDVNSLIDARNSRKEHHDAPL